MPNERLIRWYVTVGLVDPPLSRRGRVARYGRRHLLQLVAVKRRQAEGRSLAEIQAELAGATDEKLAAVARVPDTPPAPEVPAAAPGRFWARQPHQAESAAAERPGQPTAAARRPGPLASAAAEGLGQADLAAAEGPGQADLAAAEGPGQADLAAAEGPGPAGLEAAEGAGPAVARRAARRPVAAAHGDPADRGSVIASGGLVHGVRLAPGVTLLLEGAAREPGPDDVTEILTAARPLLEELARRRLYADHLY